MSSPFLRALIATAIVAAAPFAAATTYTVTSATDPGDGLCDASCTLRDAMFAAINNPGTDTIAFAIPGAGPFTIACSTPLPEVGDIVIDGYTQPGSQPSTATVGSNAILMIAIDGAGLAVRGLPGSGTVAVIRGLAIQNAPGGAIVLHSGGNSILGCRLGTDVTGTIARPNASGIAIYWASPDNHIGGSAPADRNIISGNRLNGIDIIPFSSPLAFYQSTSNLIEGNLIGTAADGSSALGNGGDGMRMLSSGNTIRDNVISGNGGDGIVLWGFVDPSNPLLGMIHGAAGNDITGNLIRTNGGNGIAFEGPAVANTVGGSTAEANVIANNTAAGVTVIGTPGNPPGWGNAILSNSMFGNGGLDIDLNGDGSTANDAGDADTGANDQQNFPVLTSMTVSGMNVTVSGSLDSTPLTTFTIQIFDEASPASLRASFDVTTDDTGTALFSAPLSGPAAAAVRATATLVSTSRPETSEFSAPISLGGAPADVPALSTSMLIAMIIALGAIAIRRVS